MKSCILTLSYYTVYEKNIHAYYYHIHIIIIIVAVLCTTCKTTSPPPRTRNVFFLLRCIFFKTCDIRRGKKKWKYTRASAKKPLRIMMRFFPEMRTYVIAWLLSYVVIEREEGFVLQKMSQAPKYAWIGWKRHPKWRSYTNVMPLVLSSGVQYRNVYFTFDFVR